MKYVKMQGSPSSNLNQMLRSNPPGGSKLELLQTPKSNVSRLTTQMSSNIKKSRSNSIENQRKVNTNYQISKRILTSNSSEDHLNEIDCQKIKELFNKDYFTYSKKGAPEPDQGNNSPSMSWRLNTEETAKQENAQDNIEQIKLHVSQQQIENNISNKFAPKFELMEREIQILSQRFSVLEQQNKLLEKYVQQLFEEKSSYKIENESLSNQVSQLLQINQSQKNQIQILL